MIIISKSSNLYNVWTKWKMTNKEKKNIFSSSIFLEGGGGGAYFLKLYTNCFVFLNFRTLAWKYVARAKTEHRLNSTWTLSSQDIIHWTTIQDGVTTIVAISF